MNPFAEHTTAELVSLKEDLHSRIVKADEAQDATEGHDLRCVLDQVVAELEVRNAAHQNY